jgi:hypothetical protein
MTAPTDVVLAGPDRNFGDMALGEKYAPGARKRSGYDEVPRVFVR